MDILLGINALEIPVQVPFLYGYIHIKKGVSLPHLYIVFSTKYIKRKIKKL
jgi:hypothetical protein